MKTLRHELPHGSHPQPLFAILRQTTDIQDNISIFSTEYIVNKISSV